jgi:hypothetical protein
MHAKTELEVCEWNAIETDEAELDAAVQAAAIGSLLKTALARLVRGDREGLHGLATAFGFAADRQEWPVTRALCGMLSNACDRLWLLTAPSPAVQQYSCVAAE